MAEFWDIVRADDARAGRFPTPAHTASSPGQRLAVTSQAPPGRKEADPPPALAPTPIISLHRRACAARDAILGQLGIRPGWAIPRSPDAPLPPTEKVVFRESTVTLVLSEGLIATLANPDEALAALDGSLDPYQAPVEFTFPLTLIEK